MNPAPASQPNRLRIETKPNKAPTKNLVVDNSERTTPK